MDSTLKMSNSELKALIEKCFKDETDRKAVKSYMIKGASWQNAIMYYEDLPLRLAAKRFREAIEKVMLTAESEAE